MKTTWKIVKSRTSRKIVNEGMHVFIIEWKSTNNHQVIANAISFQ